MMICDLCGAKGNRDDIVPVSILVQEGCDRDDDYDAELLESFEADVCEKCSENLVEKARIFFAELRNQGAQHA